MMHCHWARALMLKQRREPLPVGERERLARHLGGCPTCRMEQAQLAECAETLSRGGRAAAPTASGTRAPLDVLLRRAAQPGLMASLVGAPGSPQRWAVLAAAGALA